MFCSAAFLAGCTLIFGDPLTGKLADSDGGADLAAPDLRAVVGDLATVEMPALVCTRPLDAPDDDRHCGPCDIDCTTLPNTFGQAYCSRGECQLSCYYTAKNYHCSSDPRTGCDTDIAAPESCGKCGERCPLDKPLCARGSGCVAACRSGESVCNGSCVELETSGVHCGRCDHACNDPASIARHEMWSCNAGACVLEYCQAGYVLASGICSARYDVVHAWSQNVSQMAGIGSDVYALAGSVVVRRAASGGFAVEQTGASRPIYHIAAAGSELLAAGPDVVLRRDANGSWTSEAAPLAGGTIYDLDSGGGVTWATARLAPMGSKMRLFQRSGAGAWSEETLPNGDEPYRLGVTPAGELYVLGYNTAVLNSRLYRKPIGGALAMENVPIQGNSYTSVVTRNSDVWIFATLASSYHLLHKSGSGAWQSEDGSGTLIGIAANDAGELFLASHNFVIHRVGATSTDEGTALPSVNGVWVSPMNEVFAFGWRGISRRR